MRSAPVLGGGGFLGSHLTARLKREGYWVRCVALHLPRLGLSPADEFIIGNLRNLDVCRAAIRPGIDEIYPVKVSGRGR